MCKVVNINKYILGDVLTKFLYFIIKQRKLIMKEFDKQVINCKVKQKLMANQ